MKRVAGLGALLAVAFVVGLWAAPGPGPAEIVREIVEVPLPELERQVQALTIETEGLRARLEAAESRPPRTIIRTDTLIREVPDTVLRIVTVRGGELAFAPLIRVGELWAPELHRVDVADCDDGWSVGPGGVVCDRARFGHLWLGATSDARVSLTWAPRFRARWGVELGYGERLFGGVRLRVW